ncbi:hypothetical protein NDU88_001912 [Pleurodeles waltl]|uniref:Uncharacterized protein n=1 Tax=Pleurodeles waltl TaxID=8319 RepID=A0AAV7SC71_PLEWA|nr:hypothetical protein NDU88_001912 [Pleurodeles waltl]
MPGGRWTLAGLNSHCLAALLRIRSGSISWGQWRHDIGNYELAAVHRHTCSGLPVPTERALKRIGDHTACSKRWWAVDAIWHRALEYLSAGISGL